MYILIDMRFLLTDTSNGFQVKNFPTRPARYAILSHRWGENEVLLEDLKLWRPADGSHHSPLSHLTPIEQSNGTDVRETSKMRRGRAFAWQQWGSRHQERARRDGNRYELPVHDFTSECSRPDDDRFEKLRRCCEKARADGYEYVWIDTCCIDQNIAAPSYLSPSIRCGYCTRMRTYAMPT